ncbi:hypothetical protein [Halorubrum sp. DTA98]|uniref:hypothetical protein n=1 Tax=Halorubrum sp. DTA98 TaxID=3402163 RepID=UPI003AAE06B7
MPEITVQDVFASGSSLQSSFTYSRELRQYFDEEPFYVEYDVPVSDVPEGILSIPVLAHLCPVAWATGADVTVPVLDERFLESITAVKSVLCEMYPTFMEGGDVVPENVVDTTPAYDEASNAGVLFTGGVDSLSTYITHRDENPTLINVQGWVVGIDETDRWRRVQRRMDDYAARFGVDTQQVRSNMLECLDTSMLNATFGPHLDGQWYSAVGGGLGLLGLCAPLTVAQDMGRLYIGATFWEHAPAPDVVDHWDGRAFPWGSHPDIDGNVAWGRTRAAHVGFDRNRQERIEVIADYVQRNGFDLPVRSCSHSQVGGNCNRCEKCIRTGLGIALAGLDPNDHGFDLDRTAFDHAIEQFERGAWLITQHAPYYWQYYQQQIDPDQDLPVSGSDRFVRWLQDADFESITGMPKREQVVHTMLRNTPYPLYSGVRSLYRTLKTRRTATHEIGRMRRTR